jgi:peptidoglycan hydrolase CwlO-like protein
MVTMLTAQELARNLSSAQARIREMIAEIDRRDELIGQLQTENNELRQRITELDELLGAAIQAK